MKPIIKVENLSKEYQIGEAKASYITLRDSIVNTFRNPLKAKKNNNANKFWALKDINFEIEPGEVVGIIGRNGAGKSTLLKILSRITEPTTGEISLYGRVGSLLEVGTGFHPELTGRENVFLNGAILGMKRSEIAKKFDEIVDFAEIEKFIDTPVKFYSSGMYTRLAFAVAAHLEPEILIVDEVLAVGDGQFQKKCLGKMKDVSDTGKTVIFVSHNMTAIQSLCKKAIWLNKGEMKEFGKTTEVIDNYLGKGFSNQILQEWDDIETAPGNEYIRITRAAVVPENNSNDITVNSAFKIEFQFLNLINETTALNLSLVLWSSSGECIFNVATKSVMVDKGRWVSSCYIPKNLLNDNTYTVEIYFVQDLGKLLYRQSEILAFEVHDIEREGNWYGKWIGAVRPNLDFDLLKV